MQKTKKSPVSMDSAHRVKKEKIIIAENVSDSAAPISDAQKRAFLKALGIAGAGALVYSMFPKKASAMIFGSAPRGAGSSTTDPEIMETLQRIEDEINLSGYGGGIYVSPDGTYPEAEMKTYAEWLVDKTGFWQVIFLPAAAASVNVSATAVNSFFILPNPILTAGGDAVISIAVISCISSVADPVINVISSVDVSTVAIGGTVSIVNPSVTATGGGDISIFVAAISVVALIVDPVISTQTSVTISAASLSSTMAVVSPVISAIGNASFAATAISTAGVLPAPVVTGEVASSMVAIIPTNAGFQTANALASGELYSDSLWSKKLITNGGSSPASTAAVSIENDTIESTKALRISASRGSTDDLTLDVGASAELRYRFLKTPNGTELDGDNKSILYFSVKENMPWNAFNHFKFYFKAYRSDGTQIYKGSNDAGDGYESFFAPVGSGTQNCAIDMNAIKVVVTGTHTWADVTKVEVRFVLEARLSGDAEGINTDIILAVDNFRSTLAP